MQLNDQPSTDSQPNPQFVNPPYNQNLPMPVLNPAGQTIPDLSTAEAPHTAAPSRTSRPAKTTRVSFPQTVMEPNLFTPQAFTASHHSTTGTLLTEGEEEMGAYNYDEDEAALFSSADSPPSSPEPPKRMPGPYPMTFGAPVRSALDMPLRNSRDAPKTFKGKHAEVEYFIQHYDRLLIKFRVTDPYDQCEYILDYCSPEVQAFIRASEHYQKKNWQRLRREILKCYDAERAITRYRPSDITTYTLKTKNKPIHNLTQWKRYYIKYKTMAGTLHQQGHVTTAHVDVYFWLGIHKDLRQMLENCILQHSPARDSSRQYSIREINSAAEWYFRRNRVETMVVNTADYDIDNDGGYYEMSSEESDNSEESDYEHTARSVGKRPKHARRKKSERCWSV
jgi:hypothetical protein